MNMPTLCEIKERMADLRQERDELRLALDRSEKHAIDNKAMLRNANVEIDRLEAELVAELRSELAIANAYCANATAKHCVERLTELAADAAKGEI